ncbi:MAG: hypothetical protein WC933_00640 [Candidatus Paceibacterota bacterium]|jgi:hypothetical protein
MNKKLLQITTTLISFMLMILPLFAFSAATTIANPLGNLNDIPSFVAKILGYIVKIGGVFAIFMFILSGYKFVVAQGNPEKLKDARTTFINTCIGVAVLLGAQLIASIIVGTLKTLK